MTNKTQTYQVALYLPPFHYNIARAIAEKNQEPMGALLKRLLLPQIEEAASASFRASNALHNAIKNNELSEGLANEILAYLKMHSEDTSESVNEVEE